MDGFSYNNIFETKGIEYLVIIAFFLILIPFWIKLNKKVKTTEHVQKTLESSHFRHYYRSPRDYSSAKIIPGLIWESQVLQKSVLMIS